MACYRYGVFLMALAAIGCGESNDVGDAGARGDGGGMDATVGRDAGSGDDAGSGEDAGPTEDAGSRDAGPTDAGPGDAGPIDAGPPADAGPLCEGMTRGRCDGAGTMCLCCPAGGPLERCLCTTACSTDADCTDASRPLCNRPMGGPGTGRMGICTPRDFACAWGAICASPDTPIDTPKGERPIAALAEGDLVLSLHQGRLQPRPIRVARRTRVQDHAVVQVTLATGRVLEISGGHPTADGRRLDALAPGDTIDGVDIVEIAHVPYRHAHTYDILPDSDTGTYVAGGVLIGSTLLGVE